MAIIACVFFLPFGIVALAMHSRSRATMAAGQTAESRERLAGARRWSLYAYSTGLALIITLLIVLALTANNFAVYQTFLDPPVIIANFGYLLGGFWLNVSLFLVAEVVILIWSTIVAAIRELPGKEWGPLRSMAVIYSDVFRGMPVLLVLLIVGLGLKRTGLPVFSSLTDFQAALIALTLSYGAYMSEVIRAGLHSVHWSQAAAARSLGLSYFDAFRLVVLPQAVRTVIPPLLNGFISLQKDTALVSVLGLLDGVNRAQAVSSYSASLAPYAGIAVCYIVITIPLTRLTDYLEAKNRKKRLAAG
jgi:amine acid ABC transporter, permease protein, 3-TM region, His/Glu/Gln/Arg/opine family